MPVLKRTWPHLHVYLLVILFADTAGTGRECRERTWPYDMWTRL